MGQIRFSGFTRRALIATSMLLSVMRSKSANARSNSLLLRSDAKILVAYFTRSGNTQVIAGTLHRNVGGEIFEIRPARPYPEDYEQTVAQAKQERDSGYEPPLAATVPHFNTYDTVFLGFPIWGETTPPVIRSFLQAHDWKGKILRPFITHGGYGVGNSPSVLASHAVGATIEAPFVMEADQERRTLNEVRGWLNDIRHT